MTAPCSWKNRRPFRLLGWALSWLLVPVACTQRVEVLLNGNRDAAEGTGGQADAAIDGGGSGAVPISQVAVGGAHSCAILSGRLQCWGSNLAGQLGVALDREGERRPAAVNTTRRDWADLALGEAHSCARTEGGRVYCWGDNGSGQLGEGSRLPDPTPARIALPEDDWAEALASGAHHVCAAMATGRLYCWGRNAEGQLGDDDREDHPVPVRVGDEDLVFVDVFAGEAHTCAREAGGRLFCTGRNASRQLGFGDDSPAELAELHEVRALADARDGGGGEGHTCAIDASRVLYCWGDSADGRLGLGRELDPDAPVAEPTELNSIPGVIQVSVGATGGCAITDEASENAYCWGDNTEGQLGLGDTEPRSTPQRLQHTLRSVALGRSHMCAINSQGAILCTGLNDQGQIGDDSDRVRTTELSPVALEPS